MKVFNNISVKQITFDGVTTDFYLSDNVYYRDKVISQIRFFAVPQGQTMTAPFEGASLIDESELKNFIVTFQKDNKQVLAQNFNMGNIGMRSNIYHTIDSKIDFNLSYITYLGNPASLSGKAVLMYVYWDVLDEDDEIAQDITSCVSFSVQTSNPVKISDYIDEWIRRDGKTVKAISCYGSDLFYVDLREQSGRVFEKVPSVRLLENTGTGTFVAKRPMYLNDFDVDFKNSWIIPAQSAIDVRILIYY